MDVVAAHHFQFRCDESIDFLGDVLNHEAKVVGVAKKIDEVVDCRVDRSDYVVFFPDRPLDAFIGVILADVLVLRNY